MGKYPNLQVLNLQNNKLTSLPAFKCQKLAYFHAYNNLLESIDRFSVGKYPNLKSLCLHENKLANVKNLKSSCFFDNLQHFGLTVLNKKGLSEITFPKSVKSLYLHSM